MTRWPVSGSTQLTGGSPLGAFCLESAEIPGNTMTSIAVMIIRNVEFGRHMPR
jgi:hypothetical protein